MQRGVEVMNINELKLELAWAKKFAEDYDEHQYATKRVEKEDVEGKAYYEGQVDILTKIISDLEKEGE
jgi:hypothetical protein